MYRSFGEARTIKLFVYDFCKYSAMEENFATEKIILCSNVIGFEVVDDERANEIERNTDYSCIDELHEYLVIYFENGETATFRNSYVDMFVK